ncbi:hypothetical protein BH09ACT4_BH09ACT4_22750 [soil metagenome]
MTDPTVTPPFVHWQCALCDHWNETDGPRCEKCAALRQQRVGDPADTRPVSRLANRAILFAALPILVNVVSNAIEFGLDGVYGDGSGQSAPLITQLALAVLILSRLGIIVLIVFAAIFAVRAWPETAPTSEFRGRGRLIWTFILCGVFFVGLILTVFRVVGT